MDFQSMKLAVEKAQENKIKAETTKSELNKRFKEESEKYTKEIDGFGDYISKNIKDINSVTSDEMKGVSEFLQSKIEELNKDISSKEALLKEILDKWEGVA